MLSASAWLWDGLHSVSYKIAKRQQIHSWEGKTVCLNDTYKRYFCIKAGNWATYSLLKIKRPLEECSSSPPAPYPNPQLTDFLIRLGQWKGKKFKPTRPCEAQKSKAWGMEAMSPGSMAGSRPFGPWGWRQCPSTWRPLYSDLAEHSPLKSKAS